MTQRVRSQESLELDRADRPSLSNSCTNTSDEVTIVPYRGRINDDRIAL